MPRSPKPLRRRVSSEGSSGDIVLFRFWLHGLLVFNFCLVLDNFSTFLMAEKCFLSRHLASSMGIVEYQALGF